MTSRTIAIYGIYLAIFLIFGLIPNIGYIRIGPIAITTMALPLTLITIHKEMQGALVGVIAFALTSAITLPYQGQIFVSALGLGKALIVVILARIAIFIPLCSYLLLIRKKNINPYVNGVLIAILISIFNTTFVLSLLALFGFRSQSFWDLFILLGLTNILPEWTIIPALGSPLGKVGTYFKNRDQNIDFVSHK